MQTGPRRKKAPFAMEDENDYTKPPTGLSSEEFAQIARKNFEASRVAYVNQKSKARMAHDVGITSGEDVSFNFHNAKHNYCTLFP
jgi:hypothetical protein